VFVQTSTAIPGKINPSNPVITYPISGNLSSSPYLANNLTNSNICDKSNC
jgi:hypothetical protein